METSSIGTHSKSKRILVISILIGVAVIVVLTILFYSPLRNYFNKTTGSSTNSPTTSFGSWITYTSDKNDFTAVLPSQPVRNSSSNKDTDTDITVNSEVYTAGVKGDAYVINVFRYIGTVDLSNPKINLQNLLTTWVVQDKNNILQSSAFSKIDNRDALDFHIVNGTENVKGRIIAKGQAIYVIFADYQDQQPAAPSYKKFIDGFSFE